jgi:hypothetical protein
MAPLSCRICSATEGPWARVSQVRRMVPFALTCRRSASVRTPSSAAGDQDNRPATPGISSRAVMRSRLRVVREPSPPALSLCALSARVIEPARVIGSALAVRSGDDGDIRSRRTALRAIASDRFRTPESPPSAVFPTKPDLLERLPGGRTFHPLRSRVPASKASTPRPNRLSPV